MVVYKLTQKQSISLKKQGYVYITRNGEKIRVVPSMVDSNKDCYVKSAKKYKLLISSGSKKQLENQINKFYFSKNWKILPDNTLNNAMFSPERNRDVNLQGRVIQKGCRWRYEMVV